MGQKVNPISFRLGINRTWSSRWYLSGQSYVDALHEDLRLRQFLLEKLKFASVSKVIFERAAGKLRVFVHSARPGVVIGRRGNEIEVLTKQLSEMTGDQVNFNVVEVRKPELDAVLVAESVAQQLERRVSFRRAMKRAVQSAQRLKAEGIRINCAGRLSGAEIARTEWYREGRVPLHTLRAYIDYGTAIAHTNYGVCGIKVWIYKGQLTQHDGYATDQAEAAIQSVGSSSGGGGNN